MIQSIPDSLRVSGLTQHGVQEFLANHQFPLIEKDYVTFVFQGEAEHVGLRHWIYGLPAKLPLIRIANTDLWIRSMQFPENSRIEYKFGVTRHGHEEWVHDPLNPQIALDPFGGNSVVRTSGLQDPAWARHKPGTTQGKMERWQIYSEAMESNRDVAVYLPHSYQPHRRYRLLVVHDGDDYLRFSQMETVLNNLIDSLEIPPLVVAFSNPHKRLNEYANDKRHADHIVKELLPELESRYSVMDEASGRCLMGASFGGVATMSTAWHHPGVFGSLMVQSGSFAFTDIGDHSRSAAFDRVVEFMNAFRANPGVPSKRIFVSCGVYESLIYENRSLVPFLMEQGIEVKYSEARDGHNWENWRDRLRDGLSWLFPGPLWFTYL